jgi:hypothetical protein
MRHDGGNALKSQDNHEGLRALPLKSVECGRCGLLVVFLSTFSGGMAQIERRTIEPSLIVRELQCPSLSVFLSAAACHPVVPRGIGAYGLTKLQA